MPQTSTMRRRSPDRIERLYRQGTIDYEIWRAAREIQSLTEALSSGGHVRPGDVARSRRQRRGPTADAFGFLGGALRHAYWRRYRTWCRELAAMRVGAGGRATALAFMRAAVIEERPFREIERALGVRRGHGEARRLMLCLLTRYAAMAGDEWSEDSGFAAWTG